VTPSVREQLGPLARRSIARSIRQPILIVPSFVFPLFMLAVLSAAGGQVTKVPGFPTHSYLTFILGATFIMVATGAMNTAGSALASDIESGFLNRLALTPISGAALVSAQLAGVAVLGCAQASLTLLVGLAGGASVKAGVLGALTLIPLVVLIVMAFGAVGVFVAVRTGSATGVQSLSSVGLALLFMSSMVMPRNLMTKEWFKAIATYNPVSYLVEATRSLLVTGWDGQALALGSGVAVAVLILALAASIVTLGTRLVRT
jgi:ABC-2 type transport system permease protein